MSEMIERVAKAICAAYGHEWRTGTLRAMTGPNFEMEDHDADRLNNRWRQIARAAIEAMREPADEMTTAAALADHEGYDNDAAGVYREMWQAMIDAALKPSE